MLRSDHFDNDFTRQAYIGNGYIGVRVPAAGVGYLGGLGKVGWPLGTERITSSIAAGVFAKTADGSFYKDSKEAIALLPTWSTLTFGDASDVYSPATATSASVASYIQTLDLRTGIVTTSGTWTSPGGHRSHFVYRIVTDRARSHVAAVELQLTPLWTGKSIVNSVLDGAGARRLQSVSDSVDLPTHTVQVTSTAIGTAITVSEAATLQSSCAATSAKGPDTAAQTAAERLTFQARAGRTCTFVKFVGVVSGRDSAAPAEDALRESRDGARRGLAALLMENRKAWDELWSAGIEVDGDPALQQALRASEFSLFSSVNPTTPGSLGPSGLSSDGYAGTVFWDADTWMFPALLAQHPALAKVLVDYRFNTLPAALNNARNNGYKGVLYPWTSAIKGDMGDECYGAVTNAQGKIVADPNKSCTQQFHLQSDIALAQWQYYEAAGDRQWLLDKGWPVIEAVARFWAAKAVPVAGGGYVVREIQTPDEYATDTDNDAYTNAGAAQALQVAGRVAALLGKPAPPEWQTVAEGLTRTIPIDTKRNLYLEHDGYHGELIKQADVVMLTYPLNFALPKSYGINALNFYTPLTDINGPAMTDAIHSIAAATLDGPGCSAYTYTQRSYQAYMRQPWLQFSEFAPQGLGDTAYNFLTGVGGFMQEFVFGYSGLRLQADTVALNPSLPPQLAGVTLQKLRWQGRTFNLHIGLKQTTVTLLSGGPIPLSTPAGSRIVTEGKPIMLPTRRSDLQPTGNVARCRPATATSSAPGSPAMAAVDGSPATAWVPAILPASLTLDLGTATVLRQVQVHRFGTGALHYTLQGSADGKTWTSISPSPASPGAVDDIAASGARARYVRLYFPAGDAAAGSRPGVSEIVIEAQPEHE